MENQLGCDPGTAEEAKSFIIDLYWKLKDKQIAEAVSKEINHQMSLFEIGRNTFTNEEIRDMIIDKYSIENIDQWRTEKEVVFNSVKTLPEVLKVFNYKDLSRKIGQKYKLSDTDFPKRVINVLTKNKDLRITILSALRNYIPELP